MPSFEFDKTFRALSCAGVALLVAGCAGSGAARTDARLDDALVAPSTADGTARPSSTTRAGAGTADASDAILDRLSERQKPTLIVGTDRQVKLSPANPVTVSAGGAVSLKFEQAPVTEVLHAVLGDVLRINYTIHQPLSGDVTLNTHAPLPPDQLLSLLEAVLQTNGILLVRDSNGLFHVGKPEALKGIGSAPRQVGALPSGYGMVIVPLQFIGAAEMAEILRPVANADTFVRVDTLRNLLVLAGPRHQLDNWLEFVNIFDIDMLKGMSVGLFPLEHISIQEMSATLRLLTGGGAASPATAPTAASRSGARAQPRGDAQAQAEAAAPDAQQVALGPFGGAVRILPIERMNAILVVTPRAHFLEQVREWVERFDQPREGGSEPQLYVYPVQNGTATHLAGLLNAIFGGTQQSASRPVDSGVAPGLTSGTVSSGGLLGGQDASKSGPVAQAMSAATREGGREALNISQVTLGQDVRVVADEFNNALLIYAPKSEYRKIAAALRRLDVAPTQVLIEASILEVTLTDETRFGIRWSLENGLRDGWRSETRLIPDSITAATGLTNPGFSYTVLNPAGALRARLHALAEKSLLKVISSPSVMVLDNHTAAIHVGDQQPIRSSTTVTEGGTTVSSIQYKDTGVILSVTPSANSGDMVSMMIRQAITDVGPIDAATEQRSFLQREVSSRVAVRSGETLVLGGLIRDNSSRGKQGVPFLHDVPLLGALFGTTDNSANRTELLVMITPRVVRSDQDVRDAGAEMRRRMQGLKVLPGWERFEGADLPRLPNVPERAALPAGS